MENWLDVFKFSIPALIVFGVCYYFMKQFFDRELRMQIEEAKQNSRKDLIPLKVQAYERAILYLERIDPNNLLLRVHKPGMSAKYFHSELLKTIREEYAHNMAQQVHISISGWKALKQAKEETVKILNMAQNSLEMQANSMDLSAVVFEIVAKLDRIPTEVAIEHLKRDFQKIGGV